MIKYIKSKEELESLLDKQKKAIFIVDKKAPPLVIFQYKKVFYLDAKEDKKSLMTIEKIADFALKNKIDRTSSVIAYGGGITLDLAGFFASIYQRGLKKLIYIPTTLLSLTDASLGGKTGCNFKGFKNMLGTFRPADHLYVYTTLCKSQRKEEFLSALSESIKHAFISDNDLLFNLFDSTTKEEIYNNDNLLNDIIKESLRIKESYIKRDPYEKKNIRTILNLGHTFAHAIEKDTKGQISHANAVFYGLRYAIKLSAKIEKTPYLEKAEGLLNKYFNESYPYNLEVLADYMFYDKKQIDENTVHLKLLRDQGDIYSYQIQRDDLKKFFLSLDSVK